MHERQIVIIAAYNLKTKGPQFLYYNVPVQKEVHRAFKTPSMKLIVFPKYSQKFLDVALATRNALRDLNLLALLRSAQRSVERR